MEMRFPVFLLSSKHGEREGRQRVFLRRDDELLKTVRHRPNEPLVSFFNIGKKLTENKLVIIGNNSGCLGVF